MDKITNFYYDMFQMWADFDPYDGGMQEPYYRIRDDELRCKSMAIDTPDDDLDHYINTLMEFRQQRIDEEDDEFLEYAEKIMHTYSDLIEKRFHAVSYDDLIKRGQIAKRHQFLYRYYFLRLDNATDLYWELEDLGYDVSEYEPGVEDDIDIENVAAELAIRDATESDSEDYTSIVCDFIERNEELFEESDDSDEDETHKLAMDYMHLFTKFYGDDLYLRGLVMVEDEWCIYEVNQIENKDKFDHYDFWTL